MGPTPAPESNRAAKRVGKVGAKAAAALPMEHSKTPMPTSRKALHWYDPEANCAANGAARATPICG